jgi:putative ABC transport system permease protein
MTVLLRIAFRSVRKNWRHSMGAALAVAVGFTAITLFNGYLSHLAGTLGQMMEEQFMMGTLLVEGEGASAALSRSSEPVYLREAEQAFVDEYLRAHASEVVTRVRNLFVGGIASNGRSSYQFVGWGIDPVEGAALRRRFAWDAWYGKPLQQAGGDSVLLARGLAALMECEPATTEPPFGEDGFLVPKVRPFECRRPRIQLVGSTVAGQVNAVEPLVAGFVDGGRKEMDDVAIMMPLALAQRYKNAQVVSQYTILLRDPRKGEPFARDLAAAAKARGFAIDAMPWQRSYFGEQYNQGMGIMRTLRSLMGVVVVAISGMAIFSTMVKIVSERTREVGTLRSLGFVRGQVTRLFALEAAILSTGACLVGLLLTLGITGLINGARVTYNAGLMANPLPLGVEVDPASYLRSAAFLVAIAVFAAWLPARRAARRKIPDALAYA